MWCCCCSVLLRAVYIDKRMICSFHLVGAIKEPPDMAKKLSPRERWEQRPRETEIETYRYSQRHQRADKGTHDEMQRYKGRRDLLPKCIVQMQIGTVAKLYIYAKRRSGRARHRYT